MSGFEGAHSLEGAPGLEGGKRPDHMTAPCTDAETDVRHVNTLFAVLSQNIASREQNGFLCFGQSERQRNKAGA